MTSARQSLWTGIAKHGAGWRASVRQGRDRPKIQKHFPHDTDPREMQRWRADVKAELHVTRKQRATRGTFEGDAKRYLALKQIQAMPTYKDRCYEIGYWRRRFGTRQRDAITTLDIAEAKAELLEQRAPGTVNKLLRALSNLYRVLDGPRAENPVRAVPEAKEPPPRPRGLDYPEVTRILNLLPDAGQPKKGETRSTVSKAKIRLRCLGYCPITPKQLMQIRKADLDLVRGAIHLPARAKGRGAAATWQKLTAPALDAFRDFDAHDLYGPFSLRTVRRALTSAATRAGYPHFRVYDLRHSYGTAVYRATGSKEAVGRLLQHASPRTTDTYVARAEADVTAASVDALAPLFGPTDLSDRGRTRQIVTGAPAALQPVPTHRKGGKRKK